MKQQLLEMYQSRRFQIMIDICRIAMLFIAIAILIKLTTNIEAVKMLMYDPCLICMNKSGATCFYPENIKSIEESKNNMKKINLTMFDELLKKENAIQEE